MNRRNFRMMGRKAREQDSLDEALDAMENNEAFTLSASTAKRIARLARLGAAVETMPIGVALCRDKNDWKLFVGVIDVDTENICYGDTAFAALINLDERTKHR